MPVPELGQEEVVRRFRGRVLTPQQGGIVFERWVLEAFRLSGVRGHYPYRVAISEREGGTKEQIDGLLFDGWQGFLLESKCQAKPVDFDPIALLYTLVEQRVVGTMGLFFSASGYT